MMLSIQAWDLGVILDSFFQLQSVANFFMHLSPLFLLLSSHLDPFHLTLNYLIFLFPSPFTVWSQINLLIKWLRSWSLVKFFYCPFLLFAELNMNISLPPLVLRPLYSIVITHYSSLLYFSTYQNPIFQSHWIP